MLSKNEIKELKSLHQKKYRDAAGLFLVEGDKLVKEALDNRVSIDHIYAVKNWDGWLESEKGNIPHILIDDRQLGQICELNNPNKAMAVIRKKESAYSYEALTQEIKGHWSIFLDRLQDPGNFGTILRIADWYGIKRVLCSNDSVDCYNQKVIQSSMGAIFRVDITYLSDDELIDISKRAEVPLTASVLEGLSIYELGSGPQGILMMGNEGQGLSQRLIEIASHRVTIPGQGGAESLNVGVATGILMDWVNRTQRS